MRKSGKSIWKLLVLVDLNRFVDPLIIKEDQSKLLPDMNLISLDTSLNRDDSRHYPDTLYKKKIPSRLYCMIFISKCLRNVSFKFGRNLIINQSHPKD